MIKTKHRKITEFIVDETMLKVGSEYIWLWVAIDAKSRRILALSIYKERNLLIASASCQVLSETIEIILFLPTVEQGTQWLVSFSNSITTFILWKKD
ncbi:MAG: DDE-type integrase/transposase/recombinase [Candidatus Nitrosocosmicus sp.]